MAQSGALLILPSREATNHQTDSVQAALLLMQSLEDLRLAERVDRALRATGYGPLRDIEVTVHERLVILAGHVPSYHLTQLAQATAQAVPGVHQVCNELEVGRLS
jgi:osmotically-inducible protein OsmY